MTLRVVTVCTHNRTRSVLMGALLDDHLSRVGVDSTIVTAGTMSDGQPATPNTVRLLRERGIDVRDHVSTAISRELISGADLVLTAETAHVISIAGRWPKAFSRTFTLPELVTRGERVDARDGQPLARWLDDVNRDRERGYDYLSSAWVPEIADPTGHPEAIWLDAFDTIEQWCARLARLFA